MHEAMVQVPPTQADTALGRLQRLAQTPQLFRSDWRLVSQPLLGFESQLAKPELQVAMPQVPLTHRGVPLAVLQARLHAPQWETLLMRSTQALPHKVSVQTAVHAPRMQVCMAGQRLLQAPQLAESLSPKVSQPLALLPSQSRKPRSQVIWQVPDEQAGVPLPLPQARPQAPQWAVLLLVLVSQPLAVLPSQSPKPGLHVSPQTPPVQVGVPLVATHRLLHEPQVRGDERLASQPLEGFMSQSAKPRLQANTQAPAAQALVALAALQRLLQRPQWSMETLVSTH
jgi:hypothetical protein